MSPYGSLNATAYADTLMMGTICRLQEPNNVVAVDKLRSNGFGINPRPMQHLIVKKSNYTKTVSDNKKNRKEQCTEKRGMSRFNRYRALRWSGDQSLTNNAVNDDSERRVIRMFPKVVVCMDMNTDEHLRWPHAKCLNNYIRRVVCTQCAWLAHKLAFTAKMMTVATKAAKR